MQKAHKEFDDSLDKIILLAEKYAKAKHTEKEKILKLKKILDNLHNNSTEPNYKLYEAEALISEANGNHKKALEYLDDALLIEDDINRFTPRSRELIEEINANSRHALNQKNEEEGVSIMSDSDKESVKSVLVKQRAGKITPGIEGWLYLYTLRLITLPIILYYSANNLLYVADSYAETSSEDPAVLFVSGFILLLTILITIFFIFPYFKKKKIAQNIKYLEGLLTIVWGFAAWYLYGAISPANIDSDSTNMIMSQARTQAIWSGIWLLYWLRSKRVNITFVN